jgi:hypothetical protein
VQHELGGELARALRVSTPPLSSVAIEPTASMCAIASSSSSPGIVTDGAILVMLTS